MTGNLKRFTVEEFQADFDSLFERVEKNKETFVIVDGEREFIITPYEEELEYLLEENKNLDHG